MSEILFFSSINQCSNEDYYDKSNHFRNKIERENRSKRILKNIHEIINPVMFSCAMWEFPSMKRPEKDSRLRPHVIFKNVKNSSSGYKENAGIFVASVNIKTNKKKNKTKNYCMCDNATICKRISKKDSSNELIDNIRQNSSNSHIPVSDANSRPKISENEKYTDGNSNMS